LSKPGLFYVRRCIDLRKQVFTAVPTTRAALVGTALGWRYSARKEKPSAGDQTDDLPLTSAANYAIYFPLA
jgi:hypothetical protein